MEDTKDDCAPVVALKESHEWTNIIEKAIPSVVVLKVTQTRAFDTESASYSYATGFIVDAERGILLTNRHVVTPGPIKAEAVFHNREEVPVYPLYYDPIHDFGFMRFAPEKLQFMDVAQLELCPEAASVGLEIRVIGNDSGEKISILSGTIARLDRDAPSYSAKGYNDFNTMYLQAASGTKGGSSGSPVIDIKGRVVALNAGGKTKAASAFYLPLDRIVRALELVRAGCILKPGAAPRWEEVRVPRGDLQCTLMFQGFDDIRRLGLRLETEKEVREAVAARRHSTGMLSVDSVVPSGPSSGLLETGDVLVKVNGSIVNDFIELEDTCDKNVGGYVDLEVERKGQTVKARVRVQDLAAVTPRTLVEVGGASVHPLSYQQARNFSLETGLSSYQVYLCEPGYVFGRAHVPKHAIITSVNHKETPDIQAFIDAIAPLRHGQQVPLEFLLHTERHRRRQTVLFMDRQWYGDPVVWTRDDARGEWTSRSIPLREAEGGSGSAAPPAAAPTPASAASARGSSPDPMKADSDADADGDTTSDGASPDPASTGRGAASGSPRSGSPSAGPLGLEDVMTRSLVHLEVEIPLVALTDGVHSRSFAGGGVVVLHDAVSDNGLVLCDRNTVVISTSDIMLTFAAAPAEVRGTVAFLHPQRNFALVHYRPSDLSDKARAAVAAAAVSLDPPLRRGDKVRLVGLSKSLRVMQRESNVINHCAGIILPTGDVPRFRAVHEEVAKLDIDFGSSFAGVLTSATGEVRALWASYSEAASGGRDEREWCAGLSMEVIQPWIEAVTRCLLTSAPLPPVYALDAELAPVLLSKAVHMGLPQAWCDKLAAHDPERKQVLKVSIDFSRPRVKGEERPLRSGDLVVAINGQTVSAFRDVEGVLLKASLGVGTKRNRRGGWSVVPSSAGPSAAPSPRGSAPPPSSLSDRHLNGHNGKDAGGAAGKDGPGKKGHVDSLLTSILRQPIMSRLLAVTQAVSQAVSPAMTPGDRSPRDGSPSTTGRGGDSAGAMDPSATNGNGKRKELSVGLGDPRSPSKRAREDEEEADGHDGAGTQPAGPPQLLPEVLPLGTPPPVTLTICRGGKVMDVEVRLAAENGLGTTRLVHFCGAQVQEAHRSVRELGFLPESGGVYISRWHHGSPAHTYSLYALNFITEVDGKPTPNLDTFLAVVRGLKADCFVPVKMAHLVDGKPKVLALKPDLVYWPTSELKLEPTTRAWKKTLVAQEEAEGSPAA